MHNDIWGLARHKILFGYLYFVTFVDDYSHTTWLFLLKDRFELLSTFKLFYKEIEVQFSYLIRLLCYDNASEYIQKYLQDFCTLHGIIHQAS